MLTTYFIIANLAWDVPRVGKDDPRDIDDPIWDAPEYRGNIGYITLRHDFAKANGIKASQDWPWDTSKGMYILQGFHSMHCLVSIGCEATALPSRR